MAWNHAIAGCVCLQSRHGKEVTGKLFIRGDLQMRLDPTHAQKTRMNGAQRFVNTGFFIADRRQFWRSITTMPSIFLVEVVGGVWVRGILEGRGA